MEAQGLFTYCFGMDEFMRIEKLNDNQIRCILNKADLQSRNMKASELAYGSDKANTLFKEMTEQANRQFGFQTDNTPLMVEAIPLENESISLIITKVDDPEELDTRFSKFTPENENFDYDNDTYREKVNKANELLGFLNTFRETLAEASGNISSGSSKKTGKSDKKSSVIQSSDSSAKGSVSAKKTSKNDKHSAGNQITLVFQFDDIDKLIRLSHVLKKKYNGVNSLYRHHGNYYLSMKKGSHTPEEFNQVCNIICEFGSKTSLVHISEAHMEEHFELILKDSALQNLLNI